MSVKFDGRSPSNLSINDRLAGEVSPLVSEFDTYLTEELIDGFL